MFSVVARQSRVILLDPAELPAGKLHSVKHIRRIFNDNLGIISYTYFSMKTYVVGTR